MNKGFQYNKIKSLIDGIKRQTERVKNEDSFLFFPPRVYESAISHKLAEYLQDMFNKHDVDMEYDKYGSSARKELDAFHNFCAINSTDRIRPDIIVHYRGIRFGNLLAVEIKDCTASKKSQECVDEKLKRLTNRTGQFGYLIGVLWMFGESEREKLFIYINGEKYDSKLYDDMNKIIKILCDYESSSMKHYRNFLKSADDLKRKFRNVTKKEQEKWDKLEEEENHIKTNEEVKMREHADANIIYDDHRNCPSNSDIYDIYQETGEWEGPSEIEEEEIVEPSYEPPEESEEEEDMQGLEEYQYEQYKSEHIHNAVEKCRQGTLCDKDFYYASIKEKDSESRDLWLEAWQNLYYLSTNSVLFYLFDHLYCIKKQKELLELAFEYDSLLNILDDTERGQAEEHIEFLTAWLTLRINSLKSRSKLTV